jgi:hypothetical protein
MINTEKQNYLHQISSDETLKLSGAISVERICCFAAQSMHIITNEILSKNTKHIAIQTVCTSECPNIKICSFSHGLVDQSRERGG